MTSFLPAGRVLLLSRSAALMKRQLQGQAVALREVEALADDVSTDEITPVPILTHYDDKLGRYPYTGFTADGERPVRPSAVRELGFGVTVAGKRYGKGSSREHSPAAEKLAGIRLVVAESFERIYRQNADNIGLFTSTDLGLVDRLQRGEAIAIEELLQGRDALAAAILRAGGLLRFGQAHLRGSLPAAGQEASAGPRTLFEKIVARHALRTPVTQADPPPGAGAFVHADLRFIHEYYTGMAAHMLHHTVSDPVVLADPASIVVFEDHTSYVAESPAHTAGGLVGNVAAMCRAQRDFAARYGLRSHRTLSEEEARRDDGSNVAGISHAMVAEHYALPGQVVVGTDSHTPHSGALGCVAFGVGTTDMANAMTTGAVRMTMPRVLRMELQGALQPGVTAKDVVLHLLAQPSIRAGGGVGMVFEFGGSVVRALSTDERATLTNMTAELGGFTGIVEPDAETVRFLRERRGIDFALQPWMQSDEGAAYADILRIDCTALSPYVAMPGDPGRGLALAELPEHERVRIDIAYGGSCTAGKREDFDHYHEVFAWAAQQGLRVPEHVQLFLQFGTTAVRDYCIARGYLKAFEAVGARLLQPSCGACANCGPGSSTDAAQVTVSAINRNFPGRSGPGQVWLASPPTVAASAVAGRLVSFEELRAAHPALPDPARQFAWTPAEKRVAHRNMHRLFAAESFEASPRPYPLPRGELLEDLPHTGKGEPFDLDRYFERTHATGLLVVQDGAIVLERYAGGNGETTRWASRSVAKSFTSTLVGAALQDGAIRSLDDRVTDYVPELRGTLYEHVTLRQNLQMTSGQPHANEFPSILPLHQCLVTREQGGLLRELRAFAEPSAQLLPPGERFAYHSADVIVSGLVVERATGRQPALYLQDKIWKPFGMEHAGYWNVDAPGGTTFANSGIGATLRDWGRFGVFMLREGRLADGTPVLPEGWVAQATAPSAASLRAGMPYGFNWWLPDGASLARAPGLQGSYSARGNAGQRLLIHPQRRTVIAKWAAWDNPPAFPSGEAGLLEDDLLFAAILRRLRN